MLWVLAVLLLEPGPAKGAASVEGRWEISLEGEAGIPRGYVQVGENQLVGTHLRLHEDLGVDSMETVEVEALRRLTSSSSLRLRFDSVFLYGTMQLGDDILFNGATLQGGTDLETRPDFFRMTTLFEKRLAELSGGATLSGEAGLTYVFLLFRLHGNLSPETHGTETQEDFYAQELQVPLLGLRLEFPIGERWGLLGSLDGGYLPRTYSLRNEGGKVYLTQSHADATVSVRYRWTPALDLKAGYVFSYFAQHETSAEDDNDIQLLSSAVSLALVFRF